MLKELIVQKTLSTNRKHWLCICFNYSGQQDILMLTWTIRDGNRNEVFQQTNMPN